MSEKEKGFDVYSIFGQIEEAAAETLLSKYPTRVRRIPLEQFPDESDVPEIHTNERGERAKFAVLVPSALQKEFDSIIDGLRN
jgi:hypothetical protein